MRHALVPAGGSAHLQRARDRRVPAQRRPELPPEPAHAGFFRPSAQTGPRVVAERSPATSALAAARRDRLARKAARPQSASAWRTTTVVACPARRSAASRVRPAANQAAPSSSSRRRSWPRARAVPGVSAPPHPPGRPAVPRGRDHAASAVPSARSCAPGPARCVDGAPAHLAAPTTATSYEPLPPPRTTRTKAEPADKAPSRRMITTIRDSARRAIPARAGAMTG